MMLVLLYAYGKQATVRLVFHRRRRSNIEKGESQESPATTPRGSRAKDVWETFINDAKLLRDNRVTARELEYVRRASLMGGVTCKEDILFILKTTRGAGRR